MMMGRKKRETIKDMIKKTAGEKRPKKSATLQPGERKKNEVEIER